MPFHIIFPHSASASGSEKKEAPKQGPKITMGKGMQRVEPQDPMTGITDPDKLLKSDTQRIDRKMTQTPEQQWEKAPSTGFSSEAEGRQVKTT